MMGLEILEKKSKPKIKRFVNVFLGVIFFTILIGSAFKLSFIFGAGFVLAFALAIYNNELKVKPWKPVAVFIGALIVRLALDQYLQPIIHAETIFDLSVSVIIFIAILIFGWKIKKS